MGNSGLLRIVFAGALLAGASYYFVDVLGVEGPVAVVWKGAGVALLALWCAMQARSRDGWLIAVVVAFGALGDVLIEWRLGAGAAAFLVGHVVAFWLYTRNRRDAPSVSQRLLATVMLFATPAISWLFMPRPEVALYAASLGLMAATAWMSRFPRYRTGIGAVLFVASDLLIFAEFGPLATSPLPGLLIWPLYFVGQVLIVWGVTQTLARDVA